MESDFKFIIEGMEELKKMFDEYLAELPVDERDNAQPHLYDFLFHLLEMTPEYKTLIDQRDDLTFKLKVVQEQLKKYEEF